ncbi:MAG: dihydropteroate synthase [Pseudomonadota bacterium]
MAERQSQCFQRATWSLAHGCSLELGPKGLLMAIVNVTPDSFSDGGQFRAAVDAVAYARTCLANGAAIVDIGGESTRPGAEPVSADEEQARVLPVIAALSADKIGILSVDTYRARTAEAAILAGAHIINDVYGLHREPDIANVAAATGAGLCITHTGRGRQKHSDVIEDQRVFFEAALTIAEKAGVKPEQIVLDPGFGFNKETADENLELMQRFAQLLDFGRPLLVGTSRKRFLGAVTGQSAQHRDAATAATTALLRLKGAALFRVHDVAINRDALAVTDAMMGFDTSLAMESNP